MNVKKCNVKEIPEPLPPSVCTLQKINQLEKAGKKICAKEPIEQPPPSPACLALCLERIKNPPIPPSPNEPVVCIVGRESTGTGRCDAIEYANAAKPDLPWPGCPAQPPLPPPPEIELCELQRRKAKQDLCKERMRRYIE